MAEIISKIRVEPSNLEHIAKTGTINGTLLVSLRAALREYAEQAIDQCAKDAQAEYGYEVWDKSILDVKKKLR